MGSLVNLIFSSVHLTLRRVDHEHQRKKYFVSSDLLILNADAR